jgi:hypothetical protein
VSERKIVRHEQRIAQSARSCVGVFEPSDSQERICTNATSGISGVSEDESTRLRGDSERECLGGELSPIGFEPTTFASGGIRR